MSCISENFAQKIGVSNCTKLNRERLISADGKSLDVLGSIELTVGLAGLLVPHEFQIIKRLNHNAIIGLDFLQITECKLDLKSSSISFYDGLVVLPLQQNSGEIAVVRCIKKCIVPAGSECLLPVKLSRKSLARCSTPVIMEPHSTSCTQGYLVARALVDPASSGRRLACRIFNPADVPCIIRQGAPVATISAAEVLVGDCKQSQTNTAASDLKTTCCKLHFLTNMGLKLNCEGLDKDIQSQFYDLLFEYRDIFARSLRDLTGSTIMECPILTYPNAQPMRSRPYRLNDAMRKEVDRQLDEMLEAGIIAESDNSQFAAPIVMVRKSSGEMRFCIDLRKLNEISIPLFHHVPLVDDVADVVARNKAQVMSVLDLRGAFYQLPITADTAEKTTFITPHRGCFKHLRLPMGHCQSSYYMQNALQKLFRYEIGSFLCVYLDDVLVASPSYEIHLKHLRIVFEKLRSVNLKLHPGKCCFLQQELKYLGHIFSAKGVQTDPKKTEVIRNYPTPKTIKEVRAFLGLANFYRRHISHYSDKAFGLTKLLRSGTVFHWGPQQETSFQCLKDALVNSPILALPDFSQEMVLTCDASDKSISFNLSQVINGLDHVIEYGARGLRKSELNYSVSQKELLAIITGVQHYHDYLSGAEFLIRTDNSALQYLNSMKHATGRLGRWNLLLSTYKYRVEHVKGTKNVVADALSRLDLPEPDDGVASPETELDNLLMNIDVTRDANIEEASSMPKSVWEISFGTDPGTETRDLQTTDIQDNCPDLISNHNIAEKQQRCLDCEPLLEYIKFGILPSDDAQARKIIFQAERYIVEDDILYHLELPRNKKLQQLETVRRQLVVPRELRELILKSYHDKYCHISGDKMYNTIRTKFFWINMYTDVFQWCKTCLECQSGKAGAHTRAPLRSLPVETTIFERWHVDHLSLPECHGYKHVLVVIDSFSLYSILLPTKTTGAEETAKLLYDNLFMQYGAKTLLSDRGSAFRSKLVQELCRLLGVRQAFTSSRHPESNNRCEAFNKNLLNSLRTRCESQPNWPNLLSTIGFTFRTSVVKSLGMSPYQLVFGIEPRVPIDDILLPSRNLPANAQCYFSHMNSQLQLLRETARQNQIEANARTAVTYNARHGVKMPIFAAGDRVWLHDPRTTKEKLGHKIAKKWRGPFLILQASPEYHVYKLQDCATQKELPSLIHANRLRLFNTSRDEFYTKNNTTLQTDSSADDYTGAAADASRQQQHGAQSADTLDTAGADTGIVKNTSAAGCSTQDSTANTDTTDLSDWHTIKAILRHKRRGRNVFYLVQWEDDTTTWLPRRDVTDTAVDIYWLDKTKKRRRKRS